MKISPEEFSREIIQAYDRLPSFLRREAEKAGVAVVAEDRPADRGEPPFAEFIGPTVAEFRSGESAHPPTIVLYRRTFESACGSKKKLQDEIYRTLVHELGHFLGLEEDDLEDV